MIKAQACLKAGKTKKSAHGDFADYTEIMAENYVSKYVVGDEEVEQAMPGEIDPNCRMTTHLS
jgi:DNA polymerase III sliding clamp (beta) subunit (PCNA family)